MNIIFFGSSHFAVWPLKAIIEAGHRVVCVVTQPDRKKGRGLHVEGTPVKEHARALGIPVLQPAAINAAGGPIEELKRFEPDLFVVVAYGQILSRAVLAIPRIMAINAHASLLPKYRGAAPINWALINGEERTGVTIIRMTEKMDAGPVILQRPFPIAPEDTASTLNGSLARLSGDLLAEAIPLIARGAAVEPQDEQQATYAPKLTKLTGLIRWEQPAGLIHNLVRGCLEWPGAYTHYRGRVLKLFAAAVCPPPQGSLPQREGKAECGEVAAVTADHIYVACGEGYIRIERLQLESGRRMDAHVFIAGHKIKPGEKFI